MKIGCDLSNHLADIEVLPVEVGFHHPREGKQVVDQQVHPLRGVLDFFQVYFAFRIQPVAVVFQEGIAESVDGAQRRPEIV
ncbi:MAG: hypothetical protein BWX45_00635 [Deltaproteobacteria bacterium ADurb.Bin002]|nr:MAG: hypothetical protein BWX45_00635 [Deltaproteobacteria bacterium ADurb.Bin002]